MSEHRRRGSWGSIFSLDGLRSLSRAATPSTLRRSTTAPAFSVPNNKLETTPRVTQEETKTAPIDPQNQTKSAPSSLRLRIRDASAKASAKLKRLGLKKPAKGLGKWPGGMDKETPEQENGAVLESHTTETLEQACEDVTDLPRMSSLPIMLRPRMNPLRCHPDVMGMMERPMMPVLSVPAVPPIVVSQEIEQDDNESDNYRADLPNALVYSKSMNKIQNYGRQTPSPARTSYESARSVTEEEDTSNGLITPTHGSIIESDRTNDPHGITRSVTGLNIRESMSGCFYKATGYNKLPKVEEKGFEKVGSRLLKEVDQNAQLQPNTPEKRGLFARQKDLLTPMKASQSNATINTPKFTNEKTLRAEESPHQHTPKNPSPLRRVYSSDSLTSFEYEYVKQCM